MNPLDTIHADMCRRTFLRRGGVGIGSLALASMLDVLPVQGESNSNPGQASSEKYLGVVHPRHVEPKVKRIIHLCMAGGPSHLETFDYKPKLADLDGKPMPESLTKGQPIAQLQGQALRVMGPRFKFTPAGESGQLISDILPRMQEVADELCVIRSMVTEQINHDPAHTFFNTGTAISGRPSMGSWVLYGLGAEAEELPGFVVLTSVGGGQGQPISSRQWNNGFLPSRFQGVEFFSTGAPVHYVTNPPGYDKQRQREVIDTIRALNDQRNMVVGNPEIDGRVAQYEMAFRMQMSVPELVDMSNEPQQILEMYGVAEPGDGSFASNCLLARRLAERGVRFIQLYHRGWDHHGEIEKGMRTTAKLVDQATGALIRDLKQRGMLDDTLVIWGGEFGRTPMAQGSGRDHHIKGFSLALAGGGILGGKTYGATDEFGYNAVEDIVHVRDFHATMLHLLGIDHKRFSVRHQGLDMRLTGVEEARVVSEILTVRPNTV